MKLIYLPFIFQAIVMFADEFCLHERRGLPKWERLGHPLDTLSTMAVYFFLCFVPYAPERLGVLIGLATFSCFFITKDEAIHTEKCSPFEHWLHSLLFMLHPTCFLIAGHLWMTGGDILLNVAPIVVTIFFLYQILRWSIPWQRLR
jgi:hypothetical protein